MSKITLNATTFDLISTLSLDDIKLLEKQNPDALAIKDKDGDVQFVVKTGGTMGSISEIEATATTAVQNEKDRKAAFIRELTGEADAENTTAEG